MVIPDGEGREVLIDIMSFRAWVELDRNEGPVLADVVVKDTLGPGVHRVPIVLQPVQER